MAKTTIDGLAVRNAKPSKKAHSSSSHRVVGGSVSKTPKTPAKASAHRVNHAKTKTVKTATKPKTSDFLEPVRGFDDAPDNNLDVMDSTDWSELLSSFDDAPAAPRRAVGEINHKKSRTSKNRKTDLGLERDALLFDEEIPETERKKPTKAPKKPKKHHFVRNFFLVLLLLLIGGGVAIFIWGDTLISKLTNGQSGFWDTIGSLLSDEVPFETDSRGRTNVLVFGTEGYDMTGSSGDGVHDGAQLTDSIMVISFDQKTKDVALLSLPRDLKVPMACSAGKINEVFWCNNQNGDNETAGAEALMRQVSYLLDIDFQYWAHVNWGSVVEIVDSLGGITVVLDEDINDYLYTGMVIEAGVPTTLNGVQAVGLARARHGTTGGDFTRGNSQQKIVEGIAQKLLENGISISEALSLVNILGDNLRTNFTTDNIKAGVSMLSGFNINNIRNVPLVDYDNNIYYVEAGLIDGVSFVYPRAGTNDYSEIQDYIGRMFSSDIGIREGAKIAVYNATSQTGVAGTEKTQLESMNYQVSRVGDALPEDCDEEYCLFVLTDNMPNTQAVLEDRYQTQARPASELPASIWGDNIDFVVIIGEGKDSAE